jgi:oligopeptide transport system ATP-binding protein
MYAGRIVETADVRDLFAMPRHPYTAGLFGSMVAGAKQDEELIPIAGQPPDLHDLPLGCAFAPRCPRVGPACHASVPRIDVSANRSAACHFPLDKPRGPL